LKDGNRDGIEVTVYTITGKQLFFKVSQSTCEECDLTLNAVARAVRELGEPKVRLLAKPWLSNLPIALFRGAFHPPAVLVDGEVVSQGFVPSLESIKIAIRLAIEKKIRAKREEYPPLNFGSVPTKKVTVSS